MVKECEVCGKEFKGHGNQKYCSDGCRKLGEKKVRQKWSLKNEKRLQEYHRKYRLSHKERRRELNRLYYLSHKEELKECSRDYYRKFVKPYKKRRNCTHKHDCLNCPETKDCVYALVEEKGG